MAAKAKGLRRSKSERTRDAIQRAALELALQRGFDNVTVDEIAERADVSPRTIYVRYPTKEAIVFGLPGTAEATFATWLERFEAELTRSGGDAVDRMLAYVRRRAEEAGEGDELQPLRRRALLGDPYLRRVMRGRYDSLETLIAERTATELGLSADDSGARVFAAAAIGLMIAFSYEANTDPNGAAERCEHGERVLRTAYDALRTLADPARDPAAKAANAAVRP